MSEAFDAIIVGAGQAGPPLAGRLTEAGQRVAVIERHLFGGTCVNTGCMPTKALVASAYAAHLARRGEEFGVMLDAPVRIDMGRVHERADTVRQNARGHVESWLGGMNGLTVIRGHARFIAPRTLQVDGREITAPHIFLNVGGRALVPDIPGIADVDYLTNVGMLDLAQVPEHLVILGGSYIGLEFGQMFRRFGARVTIIERGDRLVAREDADISQAIRAVLEAEGIEVVTGADGIMLARHSQGVAMTPRAGAKAIIGSHLLLAIGRRPNTDDLGLETAGIATDVRGYITVDDRLATTAAGVWALGDCNGRGAFTHTAYNDYEIVAANLLDGEDRKVSDRVVGYALYIDPPLGRVGLTEAEARNGGYKVQVSKRPMSRVGRAIEKGETHGLMKLVANADTGELLGAAILGTGGDEAIHGVLDLMSTGRTAADLRWAVPIHPTVSELWPTVALGLR